MPTPPSARAFGSLPDGRTVEAYDLVGTRITLSLTTFGARILALHAPDRDGRTDDVVLGYDDLAGYLGDPDFHGATVGRYANRIAGGRFELDGVAHDVPLNEATNALHGGTVGFDRELWTASPGAAGEASLVLRRTSPDGEMGFPGALEVQVTFTVDGPDVLIDYEATTDRPTVVNLTQHAYLNLGGWATVDEHIVQVEAATYLPVGADLLPLGGPEPVEGTAFDLRSPVRLGDRTRRAGEQVMRARGIDHTYVLDGPLAADGATAGLRRGARVEHPASGRTVEVWTDEPGLQVYAGGALDGTAVGKGGRMHRQGDAICLEPQHFPDSPNRPDFPSTVLRPGEVYRSREVLRTGTSG